MSPSSSVLEFCRGLWSRLKFVFPSIFRLVFVNEKYYFFQSVVFGVGEGAGWRRKKECHPFSIQFSIKRTGVMDD